MTLIQAILLGIIQGLTEFLPVSSSGHLVLGEALLGITTEYKDAMGVAFEVFVHFGTLIAVVTVYWQDVLNLIKAFFSIFSLKREITLEQKYHKDADFRMMVLILLGSLPAGIIGIALKSVIEDAFTSPLLVCFTLILTGLILLSTRFFLKEDSTLNMSNSLAVGFAQAFAIIPGISRSGSTISLGMFLGLERENAAKFSFLLSIPVIAGATVLATKDILVNPPSSDMILNLAAGTIVSYLSGVLAIKFLLKVVKKGSFDKFSYYCFAVGIIGIIWLAVL